MDKCLAVDPMDPGLIPSQGDISSLKFLLKRKLTKWWRTARTRATRTTQVIPWSLADGRRQKADGIYNEILASKKLLIKGFISDRFFYCLFVRVGLNRSVTRNSDSHQKQLFPADCFGPKLADDYLSKRQFAEFDKKNSNQLIFSAILNLNISQ